MYTTRGMCDLIYLFLSIIISLKHVIFNLQIATKEIPRCKILVYEKHSFLIVASFSKVNTVRFSIFEYWSTSRTKAKRPLNTSQGEKSETPEYWSLTFPHVFKPLVFITPKKKIRTSVGLLFLFSPIEGACRTLCEIVGWKKNNFILDIENKEF
jgi:hypothetical protein